MKTLNINQMEAINAGGPIGCLAGTVLGFAGIVLVGLGTAGTGVVAASLLISLSSPITGCLL